MASRKQEIRKEIKKKKIEINKFNIKQIIKKPGTIDDLKKKKNYYIIYFKLEEKRW